MPNEELKERIARIRHDYKEMGLRLGALRAGLEQMKSALAEMRRKERGERRSGS